MIKNRKKIKVKLRDIIKNRKNIQIGKPKTHLKKSQVLMHCCKEFYYSKFAFTLHCDFVSNHNSNPLQQVIIFFEIPFLLQIEALNNHTHYKPLSCSKLKVPNMHTFSKPFSYSKFKVPTHMK
jgi:hypothetical protein